MSVLELKNISYSYDRKKYVLENINYTFEKGIIYAIVGKSGAGKTTLLSLLSSLASPTNGQIFLEGKDVSKIDKYRFRSTEVGVIFQNFNLLTHLTARENVLLSMDISAKRIPDKRKLAADLLRKVEIYDEDIDRRVLQLSGGQQQRVAIARALSYNPNIILADEPTGNLDLETQNEIMKIFRSLANDGKCVIIVTHSPDVAREADVVYELSKK
ncbi:MAG: ABC transporter ATP-binding protein [Oscillospiraceae bacterium]|nr:ABC transporter ATP-binding protein [Oscillospiraceae bacterium]